MSNNIHELEHSLGLDITEVSQDCLICNPPNLVKHVSDPYRPLPVVRLVSQYNPKTGATETYEFTTTWTPKVTVEKWNDSYFTLTKPPIN